jgi:hypothetical protein
MKGHTSNSFGGSGGGAGLGTGSADIATNLAPATPGPILRDRAPGGYALDEPTGDVRPEARGQPVDVTHPAAYGRAGVNRDAPQPCGILRRVMGDPVGAAEG